MNKLQTELYEFIKIDNDFNNAFKNVYSKHFDNNALNGFFELSLIDFLESINFKSYEIQKKYIDIAWLELSNKKIVNLDYLYLDYKVAINEKFDTIKSNLLRNQQTN